MCFRGAARWKPGLLCPSTAVCSCTLSRLETGVEPNLGKTVVFPTILKNSTIKARWMQIKHKIVPVLL